MPSYAFANFSAVKSALGRFQQRSLNLSLLSGLPRLRRMPSLELPSRSHRSFILPQLCPSLPCSLAELELPSNTHIFVTEVPSLHEMDMKLAHLDTYMGSQRRTASD